MPLPSSKGDIGIATKLARNPDIAPTKRILDKESSPSFVRSSDPKVERMVKTTANARR
jgi:hypothetical protein